MAPFRYCAWVLLLLMAHWTGAVLAATCNSSGSGTWNNTGTWSCNAVPGAGDDVTISAGHTVSLNNSDRNSRSFTIAATGQLNDTGNNLTINNNGAVVINGTWSGAGGGRLIKNGTGNLSGTGSLTGSTRIDVNDNTTILAGTNLTFTDTANGRIDIDSNNTVTNNGTVTVARVTGGNGNSTWTNAANSTLNVTSDLLAVGTLDAGASGNTVNYSGAGNQDVKRPSNGDYFHLTLSGGGTKTLASGSAFNILGDIAIATGVTYDGNTNDPAVNVAGNFSNNGAFSSGTGTFTFNGGVAQTITGTAGGTTTFSNILRLNNASGLSFIGTHNVTAAGVTLTNGRITTGANVLYISAGGVISSAGATRFVVGNLRKRVNGGINVTRIFEVGTEAGGVRYTPVNSVRFGQVTVAGDFTVSTTLGDHPNIAGSTLDASKSVNRYWTFTKDNNLTFTASANNRFVFNFINPDDLDAGAATGSFFVGRYAGGVWNEITPSARAGTTTTISGAGIASTNVSGDYQIAEKAPAVPTPGSFDVFETSQSDTAAPKIIRTKIAGTGFTLSVMAIQSGAKLATFTGTGADVKLEVLGNAATGVAVDGNNCPVSSTVLETIASFNITGGRSTASFAAQANSWRDVRVRVTYPTSSPTVTSCSTDNFAIRPASFALAASDSNWTAAGAPRTLNNTSGSTVSPVHKAGQPFRLTAAPSPGTVTNYASNYNGGPTVSALACVLPVGGNCTTLTLLDPGTFAGSGTPGSSIRVSETAKYSEVGAVNLTMRDESYASVDNKSGDTAADCTGFWVCQSNDPLAVGRFVPDHFTIAAAAQPRFRTFDAVDGSCGATPRSFTYVGQYFGYETAPSALIAAKNADAGTTTNYRGASAWNNVAASQQFSNSPARNLDLAKINAPAIAEVADSGTATLSANANDKLAFERVDPIAQFDAVLTLTWSVSDASFAGTDQGTIGTLPTLAFDDGGSGTGILFDGGGAANGRNFRYGRLQIGSASGSQLVPLSVPLETQYWDGATSTFVTNAADNCTTLTTANSNVGLGNYAGNLNAGETTPTLAGAFAAGRKTLTLTAPGAGNNGSVDLVINLGTTMDSCTTFAPPPPVTTGASQSWLRGRWCGATQSKDPVGRATFGVYTGTQEIIHIRENF